MKNLILLAAALLLGSSQDPKRAMPDRAKCRSAVAAKTWAKDLKQIPSTVIDKGVLRNVPYTSFRSGDYELNVYGDPAAPACFEIGVHNTLLKSDAAKKNCLDVMTALLADAEDRKLLKSLKLDVDKKTRAGWTFEITPPTAEDAYGGWWISIYDEAILEKSRASEAELAKITTTHTDVKKTEKDERDNSRWSGDDLKDARKTTSEKVYSPIYSKKDGKYVPDRTVEDTGWILFICANSPKHEDREELLKTCPACKKDSTFFWDPNRKSFVCFQCGTYYDNAKVVCSICGAVPRRVRTKQRG